MAQPLVVFLAGLLGGGLGAAAALKWMPPAHGAPEVTPENRGLDEVKEQLAELRKLLDRPGLAAAPAAAARPAHSATAGEAAATGSGPGKPGAPLPPMTAADLSALIEEAATKAMEKREVANAAKQEAAEPVKRVPLSQAARELGLTAAQETDVRQAYADSVESFLKVIAEPESDVETLRREMIAAKDDPAKKAEITGKMLPKLFTKLGDVMKIEADRTRKINTAIGAENAKKLKGMKLEEEDPFGLDENISVGVSTNGGK